MCCFLQTVYGGITDTVLVQVLQQISHEQDRQDPDIDLSEHSFRLCGIDVLSIFGLEDGVALVEVRAALSR